MPNIKWNSEKMDNDYNYISLNGIDLIDFIDTKGNARVLDCGCGTGILTKELVKKGYQVCGVDLSKEMLERFKKNNPQIRYIYSNLLFLVTDELYDVIFSNQVLHYILKENQHQTCIRLNKALKLNGELVVEFNGYKSLDLIISTLEKIFKHHGYDFINDYYFPTIREHSNVLEDHGFLIKYANLYNRKIKIKSLRDFIETFFYDKFLGILKDEVNEMIYELEEKLSDDLYINNEWILDYSIIRFKAIKIANE